MWTPEMKGGPIYGLWLSGLLGLCVLAAAQAQEPWRQLYAGEEASGAHVIALWQFQPSQELKDLSGHGHDLTLRGQARIVREGPFGGALESFLAGETNDKPQGAIAADADDLSPAGAFTLEAWIAAKPEMEQCPNAFIFDKKYFHYARDLPQANWDYCLYLARSGPHKRRLMASLGFGKDSEFITGPEIELPPGEWKHIAFTYDGAGRVRFFLNGQLIGKAELAGRGPITPGNYGLVLGDRFGSVYTGFPGYIAQARICQGIPAYFRAGLTIGLGGGRNVFIRGEPNVNLTVEIGNECGGTLSQGQAEIRFGPEKRTVALPALAPNEAYRLPMPLDTRLRPDTYLLQVQASGQANGRSWRAEKTLPITIVPRPLPYQMPVVMWGTGDIDRLKAFGFTHEIVGLVNEGPIWEAGQPQPALSAGAIAERFQLLNELLRNGLRAVVSTAPGRWVVRDEQRKAKYNRVDRNGQVRAEENVCGNFPEVRQFCYNVGYSIGQTFGSHPALEAALIHTEVRDGTELCFHAHDRAAFRQFAGFDIPTEAQSKWGVSYQQLKNFPPSRVIKDDDPILTFYRWFWKEGDGWNPLHTAVHRGLKEGGRKDIWTFFDPAVRVPDIWGSGGEVDVISQWTYSYPDPIKIGQATDELFAMAAGRPGQRVMKMTQIIWYRSGTAPQLPQEESARAPWEKEKPEAPFITIAPDHLREAFWAKIARPVAGIMYHGWGSLVETGTTNKGYVFTNAETGKVLAELTHTVVQPLGPMLLQVPDRPTDVALLESFTSQMFARRGTYGWSNSWEADMHLILQWAHLQPKIIFEETILRDGLDAYKVLVMPYCDVLTESVVAQIKAFQRRGGIVIADEHLCPAILPDIVIPSYKRTGKAQEDKAKLQALAASLREQLDPFYTRYGDSPNADLVLRFRRHGAADYLFVLNDKRTYGHYVGHHGRVMEQGVPNGGPIFVRRPGAFCYDLLAHRLVPTKATREGLQFEVQLGPGDGRVFLITDQKIVGVQIKAPLRAKRGQEISAEIVVTDGKRQPLSAVVPLRVEIVDAQGRPAEFTGYYGAKDGRLTLRLLLAKNDAAGAWRIKATELASGLSAEHRLVVAP